MQCLTRRIRSIGCERNLSLCAKSTHRVAIFRRQVGGFYRFQRPLRMSATVSINATENDCGRCCERVTKPGVGRALTHGRGLSFVLNLYADAPVVRTVDSDGPRRCRLRCTRRPGEPVRLHGAALLVEPGGRNRCRRVCAAHSATLAGSGKRASVSDL